MAESRIHGPDELSLVTLANSPESGEVWVRFSIYVCIYLSGVTPE